VIKGAAEIQWERTAARWKKHFRLDEGFSPERSAAQTQKIP
jgi:hypothetical protein